MGPQLLDSGKAITRLRHTASRGTQCQLFHITGTLWDTTTPPPQPHASKQTTSVGKTENTQIHRKQEKVEEGQQMLASAYDSMAAHSRQEAILKGCSAYFKLL